MVWRSTTEIACAVNNYAPAPWAQDQDPLATGQDDGGYGGDSGVEEMGLFYVCRYLMDPPNVGTQEAYLQEVPPLGERLSRTISQLGDGGNGGDGDDAGTMSLDEHAVEAEGYSESEAGCVALVESWMKTSDWDSTFSRDQLPPRAMEQATAALEGDDASAFLVGPEDPEDADVDGGAQDGEHGEQDAIAKAREALLSAQATVDELKAGGEEAGAGARTEAEKRGYASGDDAGVDGEVLAPDIQLVVDEGSVDDSTAVTDAAPVLLHVNERGYGGALQHASSDTIPEHCSDGKLDYEETDVDCGGYCGASCVAGQLCASHGDCTSCECGTDSRCVTGPYRAFINAEPFSTDGEHGQETGTCPGSASSSGQDALLESAPTKTFSFEIKGLGESKSVVVSKAMRSIGGFASGGGGGATAAGDDEIEGAPPISTGDGEREDGDGDGDGGNNGDGFLPTVEAELKAILPSGSSFISDMAVQSMTQETVSEPHVKSASCCSWNGSCSC
jgi:hypothetical protein